MPPDKDSTTTVTLDYSQTVSVPEPPGVTYRHLNYVIRYLRRVGQSADAIARVSALYSCCCLLKCVVRSADGSTSRLADHIYN